MLKIWEEYQTKYISVDTPEESDRSDCRSLSESSSNSSLSRTSCSPSPQLSSPFHSSTTPKFSPGTCKYNYYNIPLIIIIQYFSIVTVKELADFYKSRTKEKCSLDKGKVNSEKTQKKALLVNLGGMLYNKELQRGVRKRCLPEPNPTKVELDRSSTLSSIFQFAKNLYFKDMEGKMMLGDSYGTAIHVVIGKIF